MASGARASDLGSIPAPPSQPLSNQEWKDVLEDIVPGQGEWSEEQYLVLTDHRNRLVEFTDGFLDVLSMPTDEHQSLVKFLLLVLVPFFEARGGVVQFAPLRLRIRPGKFREPDLILLLVANNPRRQNRYWDGADLAVEVVSEDEPDRDLIDKRLDYAEAQVPEYWIVNPQTQTVTVLRLSGTACEEAGIYRRGQLATSVLRPELSVAVAEVFDAAKVK
jgi:Uma2 family endonuclease